MRYLKKEMANVVNAELYAVEPTNKNGKPLHCVTNVQTYFPYHSGCKTGISCWAHKTSLERAIEVDAQDFSSMEYCSFQLYIEGEYMGRYQTNYHKDGKCLEKLNSGTN